MIGTSTPRRRDATTISGTAAAASSLFTVTRTSCDPALGERDDLRGGPGRVGGVRVGHRLHDDGWADPTGTPPTQAVTVGRRGAKVT